MWRGKFLPTLILPAADTSTTMFILVNVEKVKNIIFAPLIFQSLGLGLFSFL